MEQDGEITSIGGGVPLAVCFAPNLALSDVSAGFVMLWFAEGVVVVLSQRYTSILHNDNLTHSLSLFLAHIHTHSLTHSHTHTLTCLAHQSSRHMNRRNALASSEPLKTAKEPFAVDAEELIRTQVWAVRSHFFGPRMTSA